MTVGDVLVRRRRRWTVKRIERKPDYSLRARVPGEHTGPWQVWLQPENDLQMTAFSLETIRRQFKREEVSNGRTGTRDSS